MIQTATFNAPDTYVSLCYVCKEEIRLGKQRDVDTFSAATHEDAMGSSMIYSICSEECAIVAQHSPEIADVTRNSIWVEDYPGSETGQEMSLEDTIDEIIEEDYRRGKRMLGRPC